MNHPFETPDHRLVNLTSLDSDGIGVYPIPLIVGGRTSGRPTATMGELVYGYQTVLVCKTPELAVSLLLL